MISIIPLCYWLLAVGLTVVIVIVGAEELVEAPMLPMISEP